MRFRLRAVLGMTATALLLGLVAAGPAMARDRLITVPAPAAPGPAQFNRVTVHQFGPKSAKRVLVLMPGTQGGAAFLKTVVPFLDRKVFVSKRHR